MLQDKLPYAALISAWDRVNRDWGMNLSPEALAGFGRYLEILLQANQAASLTSLREPGEMLAGLFRDALCLLKILEPSREGPVLDLGAGAGIPGIPLALARPGLSLWLLEARVKKAAFLREACRELGLAGARVLEGRAEDLGRDPKYREEAALVVSRSVGSLSELLELGLPFLKTGGILAVWKGSRWREELSCAATALAKLGGAVERTESFAVPGCDHPRVLVLVRKTGPIPSNFPRRAGVPHRKPL